jgi:hypothetical protein
MFRIFVGIFLTFLGAALELMMQVGSQDAAMNFCTYLSFYWPTCLHSLPDWFATYAPILPAIISVGGLILILWVPLRAIAHLRSPDRRFISLRDAAGQLYGELRGTDLGRFTEGLGATELEILDSMGMQILHNTDVYVRRPPSPKWELFPKSEITKMGVCDGATGIRYWGREQTVYSDPRLSKRHFRRVAKQLKNNANFVSEWSKAPPPEIRAEVRPLEIEVGEQEPFFTTTGGIWDTKRTFNVKLTNNDVSKSAEFCELTIDKIEHQSEYNGPWSFPEIRSLAAGAYKFIPLATYGEARDPQKYNCADSFFTVLVGKRQPLLPIGQQYEFSFRATAHDMPPSQVRCKLWVDANGRFRIEKL